MWLALHFQKVTWELSDLEKPWGDFWVCLPGSIFSVRKWGNCSSWSLGNWRGWCAQEGLAVFDYVAAPQSSSATGEFYFMNSMWSFSAFILNTHLIFFLNCLVHLAVGSSFLSFHQLQRWNPSSLPVLIFTLNSCIFWNWALCSRLYIYLFKQLSSLKRKYLITFVRKFAFLNHLKVFLSGHFSSRFMTSPFIKLFLTSLVNKGQTY